jgi:hypothetical protein
MNEVHYTTARPTSRLIWNRNFTVIIEEIIQFYRKKIPYVKGTLSPDGAADFFLDWMGRRLEKAITRPEKAITSHSCRTSVLSSLGPRDVFSFSYFSFGFFSYDANILCVTSLVITICNMFNIYYTYIRINYY